MTRPMLLLIAMMFALCVHAQNSEKIASYYRAVNTAELAILDSDFVGASAAYQKAFQEKFPNNKDLYNAFILAYYLRDTAAARTYIERLAYLGLDRSLLPDSTLNPDFYEQIARNFEACRNAGKRSEQHMLAMKLKKIGSQDQAVRRELTANPYLKNDEYFQARLRKSDSSIFHQMKDFIKTYGFPSFEKIGFWDGSSPNNPSIIFWMLYHQRPRATMLDKVVYKAVLKGEFRPDEWATLISYRNDEASFNYYIRFWQPIEQVVSDKTEIGPARNRIFLESQKDFKRKWHFARANQDKIRQDYLLKRTRDKQGLFNNLFFLNFFILPTDEELKMGM